MGSSSVTCLVTGVNLSNEPVVFIPLAPSRYTNRKSPTMIGGSKILGDQRVLFSPLTLPIFGRVNDCGEFKLDPLAEDANTDLLHRKLGDLPKWLEDITGTENYHHPVIDKYARMVGRSDPRWPGKKWDGTASGCWVHPEAWKTLSTLSWDLEGVQNNTIFWGGRLCRQTLKGLGFIPGEENQSLANETLGPESYAGGRYNIPWTHPELPPDLIFWSSQYLGESGRASYQGKPIGDSYGGFRSVYRAMVDLGLVFPPKALEWSQDTSVFLPQTLDARDLQRLTRTVHKQLSTAYEKNPQLNFRVVPGTTVETLEGISQTLCDGKWHVRVTAHASGGKSLYHQISGCPKEPRSPGESPQVVFSSKVWEELASLGWKPKTRKMHYDGLRSLDIFPEETFHLYGSKLLGKDLINLVVALRMFDANLYKSNRMWTPTRIGQQSEAVMQGVVSSMTSRLLIQKRYGL